MPQQPWDTGEGVELGTHYLLLRTTPPYPFKLPPASLPTVCVPIFQASLLRDVTGQIVSELPETPLPSPRRHQPFNQQSH